TLLRVVDGDTISVSIAGAAFTVRYIGIDTPETVHPSKPVEPFGPEASAANAELLAGRTLVLERDVSETDRYDRLLRHVWVSDGGGWLLVSAELLRRGLAVVSTYPPDVKYTDSVQLDAQHEAQAAGVGLWGAPPATPVPVAPQPAAPPAGNCDASYPGVCIPPGPPDLDCGEVTFRRFAVLAPDPHGFDGEHDCIVCES
ncbi:MAG: thermonuclease family protein, partial [Candidatus Limnocylindria bacterium]